MTAKHHIIYITGLGDHRPLGQDKAIHAWKVYGFVGHYHPMFWKDKEAFGPKLSRLLAQIDGLVSDGNTVSLVAASAGASAALNAYAARKDKINGVALLCGKVNNPENMAKSVFRENPAFHGAMDMLPDILQSFTDSDRAKILSLHPLADESVPPNDTYIKGAKSGTMPVAGHMFGIGYGLTFGSRRISRFLKTLASNK
jgi:pimeloyl-ACP methyl ester carboxylesterase